MLLFLIIRKLIKAYHSVYQNYSSSEMEANLIVSPAVLHKPLQVRGSAWVEMIKKIRKGKFVIEEPNILASALARLWFV